MAKMCLYMVQWDSVRWYIEAPGFAEAIQTWHRVVKEQWGSDYEGTEQPEQVVLVHDEGVFRWEA